MRIILLGNIGVGKGTQAKRLSDAHGICHISTGHILRKHVQKDTGIGKEAKKYLDKGLLVPDETVCKLVAERLDDPDCRKGYVLDGFPRSLPQAQALERILMDRQEEIDSVIQITVPEEEIVERLTARRSCPKCGAVYNLKFNPPKDDEVCDQEECEGQALVQREDDKEETIRDRFHVYEQKTKPILAFYAQRGILHKVDGSGLAPDAVFEKIESIVSEHGVV